MVYRVELNLATHTLVMSERNNGTLEHRKGSVNQGRGEAQIQTFHQFDKIKLPFLPTSSTQTLWLWYEIQLPASLFPRSSSIWNSRGGDQRVEQQLSELAKSVLANNSSKSQSPIVITHLVRALHHTRGSVWQKMYARTNKWAQRTSCIYFMFTELYV